MPKPGQYEVVLSYLYDEEPQVQIRWHVRLFHHEEAQLGERISEIPLAEHMRGPAFFDVFDQAVQKACELKAVYCSSSNV